MNGLPEWMILVIVTWAFMVLITLYGISKQLDAIIALLYKRNSN